VKVQQTDFALNPARQRLFNGKGNAYSFPTDGSAFPVSEQTEARYERGRLLLREQGKDEWVPAAPQALVGEGLVLGVGRPAGMDAPPQPLRCHLRLADGQTRELPERVMVGRQSDCGLQLSDPTVSRKHAWLQGGPGTLKVWDMGSSQGTFIDGERVEPKQWHSVPLGSELKFGEEPVTFEAEKPVVISFFGDGSTPDIASYVKCQPSKLEPKLTKSGAPVMIRGTLAEGGTLKALAYTAAPALMVGATAASLTMGGMALGGPGGPVLALLSGTIAAGAGVIAYQLRHFWKGGLTALKEKLTQPWSSAHTTVIDKSPKIGQFEKLWAENLRAYPSARHVVYVSGHGDQKGAAGLDFKQLAKTVGQAEMIVLDACNGAQLESLTQLAGSAQVAVASEHQVNGLGLPMDKMFARRDLAAEPRQLAAEMVEATSHRQRAQSLVAIDLPVLQGKLLPALDELGPALLEQREYRGQIKAALKHSQRSDTGRKVDLGSFLAGLSQVPGLADACPQLKWACDSFDQTVLAMMGAGTLTFDRRPDSQLPEGWGRLLKRL
jgi:hypothetical protein